MSWHAGMRQIPDAMVGCRIPGLVRLVQDLNKSTLDPYGMSVCGG